MNFIRLFKITGHFGAELVSSDPDIHREAQFIPNPVLDLVGQGNRVRIHVFGPGQIQEALVDGKFLHSGRIAAADILKGF